MTAPASGSALDRRLLYAFLAAGLVLRLPGHLDSGLWFDEIWMLVESVRAPLGTLLTTFQSDNNHPLYSLLAWISVRVLGEHAWTLRLPALVFGVASIGMMWIFARRVTSRAEAALATGLLVVSYHHVWFSQNARGYTMLLFWTLASTYFLLEAYAGERRAWLAYAVCLALATYTHASAIFVAAAQGIVSVAVLVTRRRDASVGSRARWAPLLGLMSAGAISLALHAGMLGDMIAFFSQSSTDATVGTAAGSSEWTSVWWTVAAVVQSLPLPAPVGWAGLVLGASLVAVGTITIFRRDWRLGALYVLPAVIGGLVTVAMGRSLRPRFFFDLAGFALLIVVAGVFSISAWAARTLAPDARSRVERRIEAVAAAAMILASLAILPRAYTLPKQDFEGALEYVLHARRPGDVVVTAGLTTLPYQRYYGRDFPEVASGADLDRYIERSDAVFVLNTIPIYLESSAPDLAARLTPSAEVARFRGSLGDGDVVVYRFEGRGG